jgi:hypothetical protein
MCSPGVSSPGGPGEGRLVSSFSVSDAHQMTWCCIQKLCITSGERLCAPTDPRWPMFRARTSLGFSYLLAVYGGRPARQEGWTP